MNLENIKAVWFDAFGTLIDDPKKHLFSDILYIIEKYWWNLKSLDLTTKKYPTEPKLFFERIFKDLWIDYWEVSQEDKGNLLNCFNQQYASYTLRPQTRELLKKIRGKVDSIFLVSNLASPYVVRVEELLDWEDFLFKIFSCDVWAKKSVEDTKIFDIAYDEFLRREISISRQEILFTWDKESSDEIAPQKAWFKSINIKEFRKNILK